ncbi:hypothetical protein GCK32_012646 [Trichostrongylus colubriformis]
MLTERQLQVTALKRCRDLDQRKRGISLSSFYKADEDSTDSSDLIRAFSDIALAGDYPTNKKGQHLMPRAISRGSFGKSFRRKLRKVVKQERRVRRSRSCDSVLEVPRGAPLSLRGKNKKNFGQLMSSFYNGTRNMSCLNDTQRQFKETRMRLFAARTAIDVHPKLILCTKEKLARELNPSKNADRSPGVFSLHAAQILDTNNVDANISDPAPVPVSDARMRQLVAQCRSDPELIQNLLYEPQ